MVYTNFEIQDCKMLCVGCKYYDDWQDGCISKREYRYSDDYIKNIFKEMI